MKLNNAEKYALFIFSVLLFIGALLLYNKQHVSQGDIKIVHDGAEEELTLKQVEDILAEKRKVDINAADTYKLETLPGIGPSLANRIAEYRKLNGKFITESDLLNVPGIGEKKLEKIRKYIKF